MHLGVGQVVLFVRVIFEVEQHLLREQVIPVVIRTHVEPGAEADAPQRFLAHLGEADSSIELSGSPHHPAHHLESCEFTVLGIPS